MTVLGVPRSTELDFSKGSPQYKWLEADLKAVDRSKTPWVVLNGHRPIYTTSIIGSQPAGVLTVAKDLQLALEDLLYKYNVDVTFHGAGAASWGILLILRGSWTIIPP